jgi:2-amino-4-hydroxy-6-hydroxymethyldihydropteridine diphosphokinase
MISKLFGVGFVGSNYKAVKAFISLGSNIEPRLHYLKQAVKMLSGCDGVHITAVSSVYETEPVEVSAPQMWFLNAVVEVETSLTPFELLRLMQDIEAKLGREGKGLKAPRTIDLDLLIYDELKLKTQQLELPHPRLCERAFVVVPLCEIAPKLMLPNGESVCELARRLSSTQKVVLRFKPTEWVASEIHHRP